MPDAIDDPVPPDVAAQLAALSASLDQVVPAKSFGNLLVGTWNVRVFDRVRPTWRSLTGEKPIRDLSNVACIAEIVRRFDVVAIQEVRRSATAFLAMMTALGNSWAFLVTDVTDGRPGNSERLAFVFDTTRVRPSGLACEIVMAANKEGIPEEELTEQFVRTPYAVSFERGPRRFTLVTLHVIYGQTSADRVKELKQIARWLAKWSAAKDVWGENLLALGDFNIDRRGDPLHQAFTSTGLRAPDALNFVPRTIFDDPLAEPDHTNFYDQIAWFPEGKAKMTMPFVNAGMFDFGNNGLIPADTKDQLASRISDHFPLWCEFRA
jgi:endonuclease/exonuclease/phosphatase family metal-dependent hydrolase